MRQAVALGIPRGAGLNHSLKLSVMPLPKPSSVNTAPLPFLGTFTGRSVRKSFRLEIKPGERDFWGPCKRGVDVPGGSVTLGGGVLGSLHLGASVFNKSCFTRLP